MLTHYARPQLGLGQGQRSQESAGHGQTWVVMIRACQNTWEQKTPVRPNSAILDGSEVKNNCTGTCTTACSLSTSHAKVYTDATSPLSREKIYAQMPGMASDGKVLQIRVRCAAR